MSGIQRTARAVFSLLSPLTGTQATGTIPIVADSSDVVIPRNTYLVPMSAAKEAQVLVKTTEAATVTTAGIDIQVKTAFGGGGVNLPIGEVLRWSPEIVGIPATVTLTSAFTGGTAATGFGTVKSLTQYEQMGAGTSAADLFKGRAQNTPALVLMWDSSDGNAKSSGKDRHLDENWILAIVVSRLDKGELRRGEGIYIMEEARELLTDRSAVDGECFSTPAALLIKRCRRLATTDASYIYTIDFQTTRTLSKRDSRLFIPWTQTNVDASIEDLPVVDDFSFSML